MSMWWLMGAQAGMSVLSSIMGGKAQSVQSNLQKANQFQQARLGNEEVTRANTLNLSNTMFNQGMMRMQDGLAKAQNTRNRLTLGISEKMSNAEVSLNQNMVGAVGASADAVLNDVSKKYDQANEELARQRQLESFQTASGMREAYTTYWQNMGKLDETGIGIQASRGGGMGSHLMSGLLSVGTSYIERNLMLGLGKKPKG